MSIDWDSDVDCILCLLKTTLELTAYCVYRRWPKSWLQIVSIEDNPTVDCILCLLKTTQKLTNYFIPATVSTWWPCQRAGCSTSGTRPATGRATSPGSPTFEWTGTVYKLMDQNVLEYCPNISEYNKIFQNIPNTSELTRIDQNIQYQQLEGKHF